MLLLIFSFTYFIPSVYTENILLMPIFYFTCQNIWISYLVILLFSSSIWIQIPVFLHLVSQDHLSYDYAKILQNLNSKYAVFTLIISLISLLKITNEYFLLVTCNFWHWFNDYIIKTRLCKRNKAVDEMTEFLLLF